MNFFNRWFGRGAPVVGLTGEDAKRAARLAVAKLPRNGRRCKSGEFRRITDEAIRQVEREGRER